jgi:hypothetical protein
VGITSATKKLERFEVKLLMIFLLCRSQRDLLSKQGKFRRREIFDRGCYILIVGLCNDAVLLVTQWRQVSIVKEKSV